jgi:group I intron endonuclease
MNNQDRTYCIYKHTSPSGKVYIGQTCQKIWVRWLHNGNGYKYNPVFWKAIQKYGWDNFTHEVLIEGISKSEADYSEKYLIKWYKLHGLSYNCTDGWDGTFGLTPWNKGLKSWIIPWNKGIPMSKETKMKVSKAKKGHKYGPQSALHILHKAEVHKKPIVMVDIENPNLWEPFKSAKDAQDKLGFSRKGINRCLTNDCVQCYGYFWFYKDQFTIGSYLDKLDALKKAQIHYKKEVCPDYINKDGVNVITCVKLKDINV